MGHRVVHAVAMPVDMRDYLLCAIVIHFNSKLETYLKDVIQAWCVRVSGKAFRMKDLPAAVRAVIASQRTLPTEFRRFSFDRDERRLLRGLQQYFTHQDAALFNPDAYVLAIPHNVLLNERSFPFEDNLNILLQRLGIRTPFDKLARISRTDVAGKLTSFQDVRNALAHAGIQPGMNANDIIDKTKDVERIVAWIDRLLFGHLREYTGRVGWS